MRELTYREWRQVAEEVESIYKKAHSSFALFGTDSLTMKVKRCWKKLLHFQKSSHESRARSSFVSQTKELFEVLKCRCRMDSDRPEYSFDTAPEQKGTTLSQFKTVPEQKGIFEIWSHKYRNRREFLNFDCSGTGTKGNF